MATGTIELDPATPPQLGQPLNFLITTSDLRGNQKARVELRAYDPETDALIYAEARPVEELPMLLGGGSSAWLTQGGPARCVALLYFWDFHPQQQQVPLAREITFDAAG